ncbi:class I SAM-dependent methyltransferase [Mesorhizobium sp. CC13]|uniref:class I SAM-dependent methyltransferase n=1 Tax=Mesorhizobium sp. CC13 TaxID=3029194 RepID=UPI003266B6E9
MDLMDASEHELSLLRPSLFAPGNPRPDIDSIVSTTLLDDYTRIRELIPEPYFLDRLGSGIFYRIPWLLNQPRDLSSLNAVEFGCGRGLKAIPWARLFKSYVGIDLEPEAIEFARKAARAVGRNNVQFALGNAADCIRRPQAYGISGKIDVVVLYAVLEHMTPREREEVLGLCSEVLRDGGMVVVGETPNRLIPHDSHSTHLHFFQTLPPEIALQYVKRSPRSGAAEAVSAGEEALYRFGQGASYHEFDLWMSSPDGHLPGIAADGWSHWAAADGVLRRDEMWLSDYLEAHGPLAPPAFGRIWLEMIFDGNALPGSSPAAPRFPKIASSSGAVTFTDKRFYTTDTVAVSAGGEASYLFDAGSPIVMIDVVQSNGEVSVEAGGEELLILSIEEMASARFPKWHNSCAVDLSAYGPINGITLRPRGQSQLVSAGLIVR